MIGYGLNLNKSLCLPCGEWILTGARADTGSRVRNSQRDESGLDKGDTQKVVGFRMYFKEGKGNKTLWETLSRVWGVGKKRGFSTLL